MTKQDFIKAVANDAGVSINDARVVVDAVLGNVTKVLAAKDSLTLPGFGTFKTSHRSARTGRNPQTGAAIQIPERTVPTFTAGKQLKESVL